MKKILVVLAAALFILPAVAQKGDVLPWEEENYSVVPFQQGQKGTLMLEVENHGVDVPTCQSNAKVQALYKVLFIGYNGANNIPAAPAICLDGKQTYNEKIDFFKDYIKPNNDFISDVKPNPKKPVSKVSKKEVVANFIVSINIDGLRKDLEAQGIIKKMADFAIKPSVLIVPSDVWMKDNGYIRQIDQHGQKVTAKDYPGAVIDKKIAEALKAVENTYGGPDGAFEIKSLSGSLDEIMNQESRAAMSNDFTQENPLDIMARVANADLWVLVDFNEAPLDNGTKMQYRIQLQAYDPATSTIVFSGENIDKTTVGDDKYNLMKSAMTGSAEAFRPQLFSYFTKRVSEGMRGSVSFKLSEDVDINFLSMIDYKGKEYAFYKVLYSFLNKNSMPKSLKEDGQQTDTYRKWVLNIPVEVMDELTEEVIPNSFGNLTDLIRTQIRDLGYDVKYTTVGIGNVEVLIIPKE